MSPLFKLFGANPPHLYEEGTLQAAKPLPLIPEASPGRMPESRHGFSRNFPKTRTSGVFFRHCYSCSPEGTE